MNQEEQRELECLGLLYDIRKIIEDVPGRMMQDELLAEIRKVKRESDQFRASGLDASGFA